jgi:hypothetical protein
MKVEITPNPDCKACKGFGMLPGGDLPMPFGSGYTREPDDYCDCVLEQVPVEIVLKLAPEVEARIDAANKATDDALLAQREIDGLCPHGFGFVEYCPDCKPLPDKDADDYDYAADDRNFDADRERRYFKS